MDIRAYFERIGYSGTAAPEQHVLCALHAAHLYRVPFENMDINWGRPLEIDEAALFDKVVLRGRGGFCYELNYLFGRLLAALGFDVTLLSARSANDDGSFTAEFDHLVLVVRSPHDAGVEWLADVAWGDGPLEPLRLDDPGVQRQGARAWRFVPDGDGLLLTEQMEAQDGPWLKHYRFERIPRRIAEFLPMCSYHQQSPRSMFTQKRLCTLYNLEGRVTLSELRLITTRYGEGPRAYWQREERALSGEEEFLQVLQDVFGIRQTA